jgi:uncharacterized protein DUF3455
VINALMNTHTMLVATLAFAGSIGALAIVVAGDLAHAQDDLEKHKRYDESTAISSPATPERITPPAGNSAFLVGHARGAQGYVCLPSANGTSWTAGSPRPEATLFSHVLGEFVQIITHFVSPVEHPNKFSPDPPRLGDATWQSSFDSSRVWAQKIEKVAAGTDQSCPNSGSIDCILLQVTGEAEGPTGGKSLTKTTFIQRLNTSGGAAPRNSDGCSLSTDIGNQRLVPYTADYYFFRADE